MVIPAALERAAATLRCPLCRASVTLLDGAVRCAQRHTFDVARYGYVNLLPGGAQTGTADTAAMVAARARVLASGAYTALAELLAMRAAEAPAGPVLDVGAGTGHYLAAVLDRRPAQWGLALDLSKYAARRAARAHPRAAAAVADAWRGLPVVDAGMAVVLDVFAPRNPAEFRRVLRPDGRLLVATPGPGHLAELAPLGLIAVDTDKARRLHAALADHFELAGRHERSVTLRLDRSLAAALVEMGPSAHHVGATQIRDRLATVSEPVTVSASFRVYDFRRRDDAS